jgi:hypothetical protein
MPGLKLGLGLGLSGGGAGAEVITPPQAPTAVILSNNEVAEDAANGTLIGYLFGVDTDSLTHTFSIVSDPESLLTIANGNELQVADAFTGISTADDYDCTIRATDSDGLFFDQAFTLDVVGGIDNGSGIPDDSSTDPVPGEGEGEWIETPIAQDSNDGLKLSGKNGGQAIFIFDVGPPQADYVYTMRYSADWSGLSQNGRRAFVGFGFKETTDFHFVGLKGNGSNPADMHATQIEGNTAFRGSNAAVATDGGEAAHGTKDGPNWGQLQISADGTEYTFRVSSDGETWVDEFTDELPTPLSEATDALQFGIAGYFENNDKGPFVLTIEYWNVAAPAFLGALVRKSVNQTAADYQSETNVPWDQEVYDVGGWHSGSNSFFTVPAGVSYVRLNGTIVSPNVNATTITYVRFGKGGTPWSAFAGEAGFKTEQGGTTAKMSIQSPIIPVTAGETFDLIYDSNDASCDITAASSYFAIEKVDADTFSGALVTKSGTQSGDFTAIAAVTYDTEVYDVGGWFDSGASTTRLTVPSGVSYVRVTACQAISSFAGGQYIRCFVRKDGDGTYVFMPFQIHESSGTMFLSAVSPVLAVTAGAYFEHQVHVEADTAIVIDVARTSFAIEKVDATTFSGALVTKSADQTTADYATAPVLVTWNDEAGGGYDVGGWHDTGANTSRLTVPAGVSRVRLTAQLNISSASVGGVQDVVFELLKNNGAFDGNPTRATDPTATVRTLNIATPVIEVAPGDYFELRYQISTDTSITVHADTSWFAIEAVPTNGRI